MHFTTTNFMKKENDDETKPRNQQIPVRNDRSSYVSFSYDAGGSIENLYNAVLFDNEDTEYVIKNNGWNYVLAPQRSVSFGYSMFGDVFSVPSDFQLCSERVDVTEGYEVAVEYIDTWNDGMRGEIIVTNMSEEPMEMLQLSGCDRNYAHR